MERWYGNSGYSLVAHGKAKVEMEMVYSTFLGRRSNLVQLVLAGRYQHVQFGSYAVNYGYMALNQETKRNDARW